MREASPSARRLRAAVPATLGQSNAWAVDPRRACGRRPILANDPHLQLTTPPLFYPVRLDAPEAGFDVAGASFAGIPFVALGHNARFSWGVTVNQFDFTDVYREQLVGAPGGAGGLATLHQGRPEPLLVLP